MVRNVTDYCGNIIYKDGTLNMILTPEGYVSKVDGKYVYHYFFKDHLGNVRAVVNGNGILEETDDYYPFGMPFAKKMNASVQPYKYGGKELEKMHGTNLYDFEARMKEVALPLFTTPDPLAEKYYSWSPYIYCMNNPMKYIDPDGRVVIISGTLSDEALRQLQERMNGRITLARDEETGRLSYTINEGQKLKGDAKRMANMIDNQSITINLETTNDNETSTGNLMIGGAFMGNTVTADANGNTTVTANQEVNPNVLGRSDEHTNTMGKMMMHEVTEAYAGAQISQKAGVSAGPATLADVDNPQSVYNRAHRKATSQTPVVETLYDRNGDVTTDITQAVRAEWSVTKNGRSIVIQTYP